MTEIETGIGTDGESVIDGVKDLLKENAIAQRPGNDVVKEGVTETEAGVLVRDPGESLYVYCIEPNVNSLLDASFSSGHNEIRHNLCTNPFDPILDPGPRSDTITMQLQDRQGLYARRLQRLVVNDRW